MKEQEDIDTKITEALKEAPAIDFSIDFNEQVILRIEKEKAKSRRIEWFVYIALVGIFISASFITMLIFIENISSELLLKSILWVLLIGGLLVLFQIVENRFIQKPSSLNQI